MDDRLIPFKHDAWSTREMLARCRGLSREQFHQRFDIGPGSLHDAFRHIIGAMLRWSDRIGDRALRTSPEREPRERSVDELLSMLDEAERELEAVAADVYANNRSGETMAFHFDPPTRPPIRFTRGSALVHVTTHGMHHRAQARYMLKKLGIDFGDRDFDPIEWEMSIGAAG